MFRIQQLTHFGTPAAAAPQVPPAAPVGAAWAQSSDDPSFIDINPAAMGYRSAPRGFTASGGRRG